MGEEQGPWWTQPPTPSAAPPPPPGRPAYPQGYDPGYEQGYDQGDQQLNGAPPAPEGESRAARFRARVRRMQEGVGDLSLPGQRVTAPGRDGGPEDGSWDLPRFEPPAAPGAPPGGGPTTERYPAATSLTSPPAPPGRPQPPGSRPDEPMVVDLRGLDDPRDPLGGTWSGGYPAPPGDATEQLPQVGGAGPGGAGPDDALGVYGAPSRVAPGIPGLTPDADPVGHLRGMPEGARRLPSLPAGLADRLQSLPVRDKLAELPPERRRILAIGGGAVAVLLVVLLMRSLAGGGDDTPPPTAQAAGGTGAAAAAAAGTPKDFAKVAPAAAEKDLKRAGEDTGEIVGAWRWTDKNGRNLLATTREKAGANQTLRVIHVARLDKDPKTLRVMTDPNLPGCGSGSGTAAFTKNSVKVRDLDRSGVAEVLVGWYSRCGGSDAESTVKLALLSDGEKYILRGEGVIGSEGGTQAPDPAAKSWPKSYLKAATTEFKTLYF